MTIMTASNELNAERSARDICDGIACGEIGRTVAQKWANERLQDARCEEAHLVYRALILTKGSRFNQISQEGLDREVIRLEGEGHLANGEFEKGLAAEERLKELCTRLKLHPNHSTLNESDFHKCGDILLARGDYQTALRAYTHGGGSYRLETNLKAMGKVIFAKIEEMVEQFADKDGIKSLLALLRRMDVLLEEDRSRRAKETPYYGGRVVDDD